ncbi:MAG: ATP-binding protein [Acidobacteria bacterium]|nr:ATP-binding protein [Acidobacteriota bacterium]
MSDLSSALLSFSARNVRSYRDNVELSLLATRLSTGDVSRDVAAAGMSTPIAVLPAAGVFGANASGKSKLLHAIADMRGLVVGSFRRGDRTTGVVRRPFLLDKRSRTEPSEFRIDLVLDGVHWQYGFEVDDESVISEYAYHAPHGRQALIFHRDRDEIRLGSSFRSDGRLLERLLRHNALLLSVGGAAEDDTLTPLFEWFSDNLRLAEMSSRGIRAAHTADLMADPASRARVLALLRAADLGITDAKVATAELDLDPEARDRLERALRILNGIDGDPEAADDWHFMVGEFVRLTHQGERGEVDFEPEDESEGTLVWVGLVGPVLTALDRGEVLLADELGTSLHPHLVRRLIELFQSKSTNKHCAQLIFNAHDVTVLGDGEDRALGRDQIWFTEKDLDGATRLYPLADFRPRKDEALERRYLQGRYGGIPILDPSEFERAVDFAEP